MVEYQFYDLDIDVNLTEKDVDSFFQNETGTVYKINRPQQLVFVDVWDRPIKDLQKIGLTSEDIILGTKSIEVFDCKKCFVYLDHSFNNIWNYVELRIIYKANIAYIFIPIEHIIVLDKIV